MTLRDEIAESRKHNDLMQKCDLISTIELTASLTRLLDFHDKAIAIAERTTIALEGDCVCSTHFLCLGCSAKELLALLDQEI